MLSSFDISCSSSWRARSPARGFVVGQHARWPVAAVSEVREAVLEVGLARRAHGDAGHVRRSHHPTRVLDAPDESPRIGDRAQRGPGSGSTAAKIEAAVETLCSAALKCGRGACVASALWGGVLPRQPGPSRTFTPPFSSKMAVHSCFCTFIFLTIF